MLLNYITKQKVAIQLLLFVFLSIVTVAQQTTRTTPKWWFGISGAANMNYYRGTTQVLNSQLTVPAAFHKGTSVRPYASVLTEYRPNKTFGGMLNIAFDNRGGKFDQVIAPCNCPANLSTNLSYLAIEPSIRIAPFRSSFYVFVGPTLGINLSKDFTYSQQFQPDIHGEWSPINKTVFAAQAGLGFDIPLSNKISETQMTLSPFASFQTDLFNAPRSVETWSIYTVRAGLALKLGSVRRTIVPAKIKVIMVPGLPADKEVQFSVRAPKVVPLERQVKETFPIRNSVFFEMGSTNIPIRYVLLDKIGASNFREAQLQESQPSNLNTGRSGRQLVVYHNILNILGDRMRNNPQSTIVLEGSSDKNPAEGQTMAEQVKNYLVINFGIESARITTEGRDKPVIPSEQPGAVDDLDLLHQGDRRVDIESSSPELLMQIGGVNSARLKPVEFFSTQRDPLDSHVIFNVTGASELFASWTVDIKDEAGNIQHFGPYINDQASIPGNTILGEKRQGNYTIVMNGKTKKGQDIRKFSSVSLSKLNNPKQVGLRYTILFDFDKAKTIDSYEQFLINVVVPLIPANSTVMVHGHTDIIGGEKYNLSLSRERAFGVEEIIKRSLSLTNQKGVQFETFGFGEDAIMAPFENITPEERFYNRTVIIDIIPNK